MYRLSGRAGRGRARGSGGLQAREAECAPARAVPPRQATAGGRLACDADARRRESQRQAHALLLGVHARWCGLGRGALGRLRMRMRAAGPHLHAGPSPRSATQESQLACAAAVHAQRADQRVLREVGRVRAGWNGVDIAAKAHMQRCGVARRRKEVDPLARDSASSSERRRGRSHRRLRTCDAAWTLDHVTTNCMFARAMLLVVRAGAARHEAQARASGHIANLVESPTKRATRTFECYTRIWVSQRLKQAAGYPANRDGGFLVKAIFYHHSFHTHSELTRRQGDGRQSHPPTRALARVLGCTLQTLRLKLKAF